MEEMVDQLSRYETYARGIKRLLKFAGLWPGHVSSQFVHLPVIIYGLTSIFLFTGIMNFIVSHITNIGLATKGLGLCAGCLTILQKVIIFKINRKNLEELHYILQTSFSEDLRNDELRLVLLSPLKYFYRPTIWLSVSSGAIIIVYLLVPPISISIQRAHHVSPINYPLPLPTQYPWTVTGNTILYYVHYMIEAGASCTGASMSAAIDALFGFYIFQMSSQFRTMSYRMRNLKSMDDYKAVFKECACRHRTLIQCRDKLEIIYGPIILCMLITNAITLCANIFQASQISSGKAAAVLVYIVMKLMQTFFYGWYGLFLTTESDAFLEATYSSGWSGSGEKSFMSNVLIMLMYKPLVVTACHFSVTSLDMFLTITNTAISYFFLLRTLDDKK